MRFSRLPRYVVSGLLWLLAAAPVSGATVTIAWDPSPSLDVTNYNVFVSTQQGVYGAGTPVGNRTTWTFTGLANNVQFYFAVQAQSASGLSALAQIGYVTPIPAPPGSDRSRGDFNGDGWFDLLWKHQTTGLLYAWHMNGANLALSRSFTPSTVPAGWELGGSGDFNFDGKPDLIWHNLNTGQIVYWLMDGVLNYYSAGFLPGPVDPTWRIASIRDFDRNGSPDIWWRNQNTGDMLVWFFNGTICIGAAVPTPSPIRDVNWKLKGTADFTGDGRPDALWQHEPSGELRVWQLGGANGINATAAYNLSPPTVAAGWRAVALGDANLDGFPDIFWQNLTNGGLVVWLMRGLNQIGGSYLSVPTVEPTWRIVGPK
jgi:hypothetical protein